LGPIRAGRRPRCLNSDFLQTWECRRKQDVQKKTFRFAVVGYGPSFNMGPCHINSVLANEGFEFVAACDVSPDRQKAAREAYPQISTFGDLGLMLRQARPDLAIIITPHHLHARQVVQCLKAGSSVVVEKPMCITTAEVKVMLGAAKANKTMLSTFHNRRWDNDFVVLRDLIRSGVIGRVFRIQAGFSGYKEQATWWRSDRKISGGAIYDWGAHFTDWILNLVDSKVDFVTGYQLKNPAWTRYTNEDHSEYTVRFANGVLASLTISNMSMIEMPRWIVRGEKGSITAGREAFTVKHRADDGRDWTAEVRYDSVKSDWHAYYRNVCAHLRDGEPLVITPESAGRVICVLDCANQSAKTGGRPEKPWLC